MFLHVFGINTPSDVSKMAKISQAVQGRVIFREFLIVTSRQLNFVWINEICIEMETISSSCLCEILLLSLKFSVKRIAGKRKAENGKE